MPDPRWNLIRQFKGNLIVSAAAAMARAVAQGTSELDPVFVAMGKTFEQYQMRTADIRRANLEIAQAAQREMVRQYASRLPVNVHSYRVGENRLSGGRLLRALRDPAMIEGTSDRVISFVNFNHLRRTARHFWRVNYGSVGRTGVPAGRYSEPVAYTIRLDGKPILTMRDDTPPDPVSHLPRTFFIVGAGNSRELWPARNSKPALRNAGGGTRAARFTDVGLQVVTREFPARYDQLFRQYVERAGQKMRLAERDIQVPVNVRVHRYGFDVTNG